MRQFSRVYEERQSYRKALTENFLIWINLYNACRQMLNPINPKHAAWRLLNIVYHHPLYSQLRTFLFCVDNVRRIYIPINWLGLKLLNTCFRRVYEMKRICLIASAYVRILSVCKLFIFSVYLTDFVCLLLAVCYKSITRPLAAYRETMTYHNIQYAGLWVQFFGW